MSYEEYLSALVPKDRENDRYAGAWNEMLAESFDAFLGLGLIYKAVTGEEAFTGDKLTQNEREEAAASGAFALTVSVLTSAIGGTGWSGFATMLLADAAGGVVGVVTYEGLTNMGLSDSEAFLLSFFAGVVTGNGIKRMAYSSPTYIDDLAKRMGKSSDEMADMLGNLSDVAAKYNYSSVDDMFNNLSPAARDDIMKMFDNPLGSFDLQKESRFFKNSQTDDVVRSGLKSGTLSNVDARKWYLEQEAKIPDLIDNSLPLEQQARQAFDLRNQYRTQARELMADRQLAELLDITDPNLTWEQVIQKQIDKGLSGDDIYKAIIESSQRSRTSVNQALGLR